MKRPFLLAEVLLALVVLTLFAPPLIAILQGRHAKAIALRKKVEEIGAFDRMQLRVLESIQASDLDQLEERGELALAGTTLLLKKDHIRIKDQRKTYLIECRAKGQKSNLVVSRLLRKR